MRKNYVLSVLFLGLVLFGIGGCGGDEDELESLTGTWEIISINRKTPAEWLLPVLAGEDGSTINVLGRRYETTKVTIKKTNVVFAINGSMSWDIDAEVEYGLDGFFIKLTMDTKVTGTYTVSGSTVSWAAKASVDFDWVGVSKENQQAFDADMKQETRRVEQVLEEDFDVGLVSAIWKLEGDVLTLIEDDGDEAVLSRR